MALIQTNRRYKDTETKLDYTLHEDQFNHSQKLIADVLQSTEHPVIERFYFFASGSATIKINAEKQVHLQSGEFYRMKDGEKVTHRKFFFDKRFKRI